jgi:hypothetical protein
LTAASVAVIGLAHLPGVRKSLDFQVGQAIYAQQDAPQQKPRLVASKTLESTPQTLRQTGARKAVADILKPAMLRAIEPAKGPGPRAGQGIFSLSSRLPKH